MARFTPQFCSSHTLREVYIDLFDRLDENIATVGAGQSSAVVRCLTKHVLGCRLCNVIATCGRLALR